MPPCHKIRYHRKQQIPELRLISQGEHFVMHFVMSNVQGNAVELVMFKLFHFLARFRVCLGLRALSTASATIATCTDCIRKQNQKQNQQRLATQFPVKIAIHNFCWLGGFGFWRFLYFLLWVKVLCCCWGGRTIIRNVVWLFEQPFGHKCSSANLMNSIACLVSSYLFAQYFEANIWRTNKKIYIYVYIQDHHPHHRYSVFSDLVAAN